MSHRGRSCDPRQTTNAAAVRRRDRGLRRVGVATGWVAVAAAAGSVVLGAGYAQALPGKAPTPTRPRQPVGALPPVVSHPVSPPPHPARPAHRASATQPHAESARHLAASVPVPVPPPAPTPQPAHTTSGAS
jgi:hypothetical protein